MFRKSFFFVFLFSITISAFSQQSINNYKYILVPDEYKFQKSPNAYDMNELVKFLFNKEGFTAFIDSEDLPADLRLNGCLALTADLINDSGMLTTKMYFELKDCNNQVIYTTEVGKSKEKEYQKAYQGAARAAFEEIKTLNYAYEPISGSVAVDEHVDEKQNEAAKVAAAAAVVVAFPEEKTPEPASTTVETVDEPTVSEANESSAEVSSVNSQSAVNGESAVKVAAVVTTPLLVTNPVEKTIDKDILYAQEIENGYQLVDSSPKVIYKALATSVKDVYMIEGSDGIIYKTTDGWVAEYYEDSELKRKLLTIKLL